MITVRRREFDFNKSPKYFFKKNKFITHFLNALSTSFPPGEDFFVRSVRRFRKNDKSQLEKDISAFIGQEAFHSLAHKAMNEYASKFDLPLEQIQTALDVAIKAIETQLTPKQCLAITIALEHYTAVMGEELLTNPKWLEGMAMPHKELWRWHASEEVEHKSVAFDVYRKNCNDYLTRITTMTIMHVVFLTVILIITGGLMIQDKEMSRLEKIDQTMYGLWLLFGPNGFLTNISKKLPQYYMPGFHP